MPPLPLGFNPFSEVVLSQLCAKMRRKMLRQKNVAEITSPANPQFKLWLSLLERKGLKRHGQFLLSGRKLVPEMLEQQLEIFESLIFSKPEQLELINPQGLKGLSLFQLAPSLFAELDLFGTEAPLLVGRQPELIPARLDKEPLGLELLAATGDPANLGALLRSAEAFAVRKVVLLKECAHPFHPKTIKASSGSVFRLELEWGPSIHDLCKPPHLFVLYALTPKPQSESLPHVRWPQDLRLIVGEEGPGLPETLINSPLIHPITIPMQASVESLNATVATSLALWEIYKRKL